MSHFYGTLKSARGKATRTGTKNSGITTVAASWNGAIQVDLYVEDGVDRFQVTMRPWANTGDAKVLCSGIVGNATSVTAAKP